jgi:hypothetical protein
VRRFPTHLWPEVGIVYVVGSRLGLRHKIFSKYAEAAAFHELPYLPSLSIDNVPVWSGLDFILALIPLRIRVVDPTLPVASRNAEGEMAASSLPIWGPDWRRGT